MHSAMKLLLFFIFVTLCVTSSAEEADLEPIADENKSRRPLARGGRQDSSHDTELAQEWLDDGAQDKRQGGSRRFRVQALQRGDDDDSAGGDELSDDTEPTEETTTTTTTTQKPTPPPRKRVNISAIDYLLEDPDLTVLADQLRSTGLADEAFFKKVAISVFAPTDAVFAALPMDLNALEFPGKDEILKKIIDYHTLAPKLLRPQQLREGKPYVGKTRWRPQAIEIKRTGPKDVDIVINDHAQVVEVVEAVKGFVYKIDSLLYPRWNEGPNLVEFIRSTPWLSKTRWLMEESGVADQFAFAGPLTTFLVPDEGWVAPNGVEIPDCFFQALVRKEHQETITLLLSWLGLPGVQNSTQIKASDILINAAEPHLHVAHVRNSTTGDDIYTFIEGKQVKQWDVKVFNGIVHILEELPMRPDLDLSIAMWDCAHDLCFECPHFSHVILNYFDNGGLLPGDEPNEMIVPKGPRPSWVCQGSEKWFPPGWNNKKWYDYVKAAKKEANNAEKLARKGHADAAAKLAKLEEDLELARIKEAQKQAKEDWLSPGSAVKAGKDPSMNIMGRLNRMQRPLPDCKHKDDALKLTTNDLRYITRWE